MEIQQAKNRTGILKGHPYGQSHWIGQDYGDCCKRQEGNDYCESEECTEKGESERNQKNTETKQDLPNQGIHYRQYGKLPVQIFFQQEICGYRIQHRQGKGQEERESNHYGKGL